MTDEQPLEPAALAYLTDERSRPEAGGEVADRIFSRLSTTIATTGGPGGTGSGGGTPAARELAGKTARSIALSKIAGIVVAAFAAGIGVGALGHARLAAPDVLAPPPPSALPTLRAPPRAAVSAPVPSPDVTAAVDALPSAPLATSQPLARPATSAPDKDVVLARERAWIERARMALARGSAPDALAALDGHAKEFPAGRMTEEREALAIHALATAGRSDEARARAHLFRSRWRSSLFLPVVDRAVPKED